MKKTFFILYFLFSLFRVFSQNLVPNCSFEDTVACPDKDGDYVKIKGWTSFRGTPDYYNACAPDGSHWTVPNNNIIGFQYAATGNAYIGLIVYGTPDNIDNGSIEHIGRDLSQPLVVGQKYYVSFKINLPKKDTSSINQDDCTVFACNKLGVLFSTVPYNKDNPAPVNNFAHIYTDSVFTDTLNWITVSGWFAADSAYRYIIIGRFFDNFNTDTIRLFKPDICDAFAYYFFDNVCVSLDSTKCSCDSVTSLNEKPLVQNITVYPTLATHKMTIKKNFPFKAEVKIYDLLGVLFYNGILTDNENQINISNYSKGIYILNVQSENGTFFIQKFLIF